MKVNKLSSAPRTWLFSIVCVAGLVLAAAGCIEQPIAPSWDVEGNAPLVNRQYTLMDVINKDTLHLKYYTAGDSANLIYYNDARPLTPIFVDKKIKLYPIEKTTKISPNTIKIYNPAPFNSQVKASSLGLPQGTNITVPALGPVTVPAALPALTEFESVELESGNIRLQISNYISRQLTMNLAYVKLMNASTNQEIFRTSAVSLAPLQTQTLVIPLAGKTLVSQMKAEIQVSTPGASPATVPDTGNIRMVFEIENPSPSKAVARIPQQDPVPYSGAFRLDDSSYLKKIEIDEGSLTFRIRNYFNVGLKVDFTVNNLRTPANLPYTAAIELDRSGLPNSWRDLTISDLHDWSIVSGADLTNELSYNVNVLVKSSDTPVQVSKTDSVQVIVAMSQLTLKSIEGKLKPTALDFRRTAIPVRLGNLKGFNADSIKFGKFILNFNVGITSSVKVGFSGTVTGRNSTRRDSIKVPFKTVGGGIMSKIEIAPADLNRFINSFINAPPDTLYFDYSGIINPNPLPGDPPAKIASTDNVFGDAFTEARLNVGVAGGVITDTSEFTIPNANTQLLDNINSATVVIAIESGIPAGMQYTGKLFDAGGNFLLDIPPKHAPNPSSFVIQPAPVNAAGNVIAPRSDSLTVDLTGDEIKKFIQSRKLISRVVLNTAAPGAAPVNFRTNQQILLRGMGRLNYRVAP